MQVVGDGGAETIPMSINRDSSFGVISLGIAEYSPNFGFISYWVVGNAGAYLARR